MNIGSQILLLLYNFVFGYIFFLLFNNVNKFIHKEVFLIKSFINIILLLDMFILYEIFIYKYFDGYFHYYFVIMLVSGYYLAYINKCKLLKKILTLKNTSHTMKI